MCVYIHISNYILWNTIKRKENIEKLSISMTGKLSIAKNSQKRKKNRSHATQLFQDKKEALRRSFEDYLK